MFFAVVAKFSRFKLALKFARNGTLIGKRGFAVTHVITAVNHCGLRLSAPHTRVCLCFLNNVQDNWNRNSIYKARKIALLTIGVHATFAAFNPGNFNVFLEFLATKLTYSPSPSAGITSPFHNYLRVKKFWTFSLHLEGFQLQTTIKKRNKFSQFMLLLRFFHNTNKDFDSCKTWIVCY